MYYIQVSEIFETCFYTITMGSTGKATDKDIFHWLATQSTLDLTRALLLNLLLCLQNLMLETYMLLTGVRVH